MGARTSALERLMLNLLHANDKLGHFPDSWYAATANKHKRYQKLQNNICTDVCIIGGGFTGLSAALHLAKAGIKVVLLDAHRPGWGASGRNGGQVSNGQRVDQRRLEKEYGELPARNLWQIGQDAKELVSKLISEHSINCDFKPGIIHACFSESEVREEFKSAKNLQIKYGHEEIHCLDKAQIQNIVGSKSYVGGSIDWRSAHLHPLNFALALADTASELGAKIFENSLVNKITYGSKNIIETKFGCVTATYTILACNGYLGNLNSNVARKVMPINNFIAGTEVLNEDIKQSILTKDVAVADSKFVVNYFRLSSDNRLLFGGGESYGYKFPDDLYATVQKPMLKIFPQLRKTKLDYAWGGTLAITMKRMPYLSRVNKSTYSASGYSGSGVAMATMAGKIISDDILGENGRFKTMSSVITPNFPGGSKMRSPLLKLAMTWYKIRDELGI